MWQSVADVSFHIRYSSLARDQSCERLHGVGTALVDVVSAVSSHTAAESCLDADLADRDGNRSVTEPCGGVNTSGAPDEELTLVLRIEVE